MSEVRHIVYIPKRSEQEYIDKACYWEDDEETKGLELKIVTTRKEHQCMTPFGEPHPIPPGSRAICEKAINEDLGRVTSYLCLQCADECLDLMFGDD